MVWKKTAEGSAEMSSQGQKGQSSQQGKYLLLFQSVTLTSISYLLPFSRKGSSWVISGKVEFNLCSGIMEKIFLVQYCFWESTLRGKQSSFGTKWDVFMQLHSKGLEWRFVWGNLSIFNSEVLQTISRLNGEVEREKNQNRKILRKRQQHLAQIYLCLAQVVLLGNCMLKFKTFLRNFTELGTVCALHFQEILELLSFCNKTKPKGGTSLIPLWMWNFFSW